MSLYNIYNRKDVDYRKENEYIILTHVRNTWKLNTVMEPRAKIGTYHFTWGLWQNYYNRIIGMRILPCHFFTELVDKDYVVYQGLNIIQQSYYLRELSDANIINYKYRDAILVVIGEDYSIDKIEDRMVEHLSDKLLTGLTSLFGMNQETSIKYIDEILVSDWQIKLRESGLNYDITPAKYFNMDDLRFTMREYFKHRAIFKKGW
jgi:hypothetical protein